MNGVLKWFQINKGYGFITGEDGQDYFLHISKISDGVAPKQGEEVEFEVTETEKGKQAIKVKRV